MIVLEGPDGAGKSTLVQHLAEKFVLDIGIRGVGNRDELYKVTRQDTYRALSKAVKGIDQPEIWDRLFVSEFVYADIVGRTCEFNTDERNFVVDVMNALHCPMIVCCPPWDTVEANAAKEHQMAGVSQNLEKIYRRYAESMLPWAANVIWYDYTGVMSGFATLQDIEEEVAGYIEARKARQAW